MREGQPRRRWFRRRGIDLGDLAIETFAAFLGVFLALAVQNWRDRHDGAIKLEKARTAIRTEISKNRELVQAKLEYLRLVKRNGVAVINGELAPPTNVSRLATKPWHARQRRAGRRIPARAFRATAASRSPT